MNTALVTGCGKGLGVDLVKALLDRGDAVFAVCRRSRTATEVRKLKPLHGSRLTILAADLGSEEHLKRMCAIVRRRTKSLDLLVNNAAVLWHDGLDGLRSRDLHRMFMVNAFAPILLARHLRPLLKAARGVIVNVSSESGGIADVNSNRPIHGYSASKAALNMFTRKLSFDLKEDGVRAFAVHPGWMQTPMGKRYGAPTQPPAETARNILRLAGRAGSLNGGFFNHDGSRRKW